MMGSSSDGDSETREWDSAVQLDPLQLTGALSPDLRSNNGSRELSNSSIGLHGRNEWLVHAGIVADESAASVHDPHHENKDLYFPVEGIDVESFQQAAPLQPQDMLLSPLRFPLGRKVTVNGKELALFCHKGRFYAVEERCPHLGGPLHLGDIEDLGGSLRSPRVVCPWHKWCFDLATGRHVCPPLRNKHIQSYPVRTDAKGTVSIGFSSFDPSCFDTNQEF